MYLGFLGDSVSKESACNAGDLGSIPELERSPGEGNDYPLQYSCLENAMGRRDRWATVHGVIRVRHNSAIKTPNYKYELFWIIFRLSQLLTASSILLQKIPMNIHGFLSICRSIHPIVRPATPPWRTLLFKKYSWEHGGGPPRGPVVKNSSANAGAAGDMGSVPGWGRSPRGGHGNPPQYSCLGNPKARGAWWPTVHGVTQSRPWPRDWAHTHGNTLCSLLFTSTLLLRK